jgi:hypothetical protein
MAESRSSSRYVPRISVDVSPELQRKVQLYIPHGYQKKLLNVILTELVDLIEKLGVENAPVILGAIVSGRLKIIDLIKQMEQK